MAKVKKNDYYEILRISPTADLREIAEAIRIFRENDKSGNYSAIINRIEETLTDSELRVQYDFEHGYSGPRNSFLDIDEELLSKHHSKEPEHHKYDLRKELEEYSVLSSKTSHLIGAYTISFQKIIIFTLVLLIIVCGIIFSKPLLDKIEGKKQAEAALVVLKQSENQVENYIREHSVFPDSLALTSNDNRFILKLDSKNNRVILTFVGEVIDELANAEMSNSFVTQPNITYWKCDIGQNFPAEYKPAACY